MWILSQDKQCVINVEQVKEVRLSGKNVFCDDIAIAKYDSKDKADEKYSSLLNALFRNGSTVFFM